MQKKAALTKSRSRQDLFNSQDRKGSWNKMSSLNMKPKAEVDESCESCYLDVLAAAAKCYNEADWVQCIIDTVKEDCVSCICEILDVDCQAERVTDSLLNRR